MAELIAIVGLAMGVVGLADVIDEKHRIKKIKKQGYEPFVKHKVFRNHYVSRDYDYDEFYDMVKENKRERKRLERLEEIKRRKKEIKILLSKMEK